MRSLVLLLDGAAPSFCFYPSPAPSAPWPMTDEVFRAALSLAAAQDLSLQIVGGPGGVPPAWRERLAGRAHVVYLPHGARGLAEQDVPVLDAAADPGGLAHHPIAILRVARGELERWPRCFEALSSRVERVVLVLLDLDRWDEEDLGRHQASLRRAGAFLAREYRAGHMVQLSAISDRLALQEPGDCAAGLDHLTVAPDGSLQPCPGFALDGAAALGHLGEPWPPSIANRELLTRQRAPICALCDAFHCRRCVHLNLRSTLEVNTPPWQLCRAAHLEREASRELLETLHREGELRHLPPIRHVPYEEPFEALTGRRMRQAPAPRGPKQTATANPSKEDVSMDRSPVGRVSPEERDEIKALFMRKTALTELFLSLSKLDAEALAASPLYEKVVRDMGEVTVRFQRWWEEKAQAHGWPAKAGGSWNIDFETCEIFLS